MKAIFKIRFGAWEEVAQAEEGRSGLGRRMHQVCGETATVGLMADEAWPFLSPTQRHESIIIYLLLFFFLT